MNVPVLTVNAPVQTVSEPNRRDHWSVRNKRRVEQRRAVYYAWKVAVASKRRSFLPCTVKLTRLGKKVMDSDNLVSSFKGVRDLVAELIGVDDGDERIKFEYDQSIAKTYGIVIEVFKETR